jgi:hypothetical protein
MQPLASSKFRLAAASGSILALASVAAAGKARAAALASNAYPPPDTSRAGTADLCDVHHPESVDDVKAGRKVQIAQPIFRCMQDSCRPTHHQHAAKPVHMAPHASPRCCYKGRTPSLHPSQLTFMWLSGHGTMCRDFGGNIKFSGKISTVLCYENNPLVRKVRAYARPCMTHRPAIMHAEPCMHALLKEWQHAGGSPIRPALGHVHEGPALTHRPAHVSTLGHSKAQHSTAHSQTSTRFYTWAHCSAKY